MEEARKFAEIVKSISTSSKNICHLENEIQKYVDCESIQPVYDLFKLSDIEVIFFALKIVDLRIDRKISLAESSSLSMLEDEVVLMRDVILQVQMPQAISIYAKLGVLCWPLYFPDFINFVFANISPANKSLGCRIFHSFLEKTNKYGKINMERRKELKKATQMIIDQFISHISDDQARIVIPIMKELLTIVPKEFDYSYVFRNASRFPNETSQFFFEGFQSLEVSRIIEVLPSFPANFLMSLLFSSSNKIVQSEFLMAYMFRCISVAECFSNAVNFWQRAFANSKVEKMFVIPVLTEVFETMISCELFSKDNDAVVLILIQTVASSFPEETCEFVRLHANDIGDRFALLFITKLSKCSPNLLPRLHGLNNPVLDGYVCYFLNDPKTPEIIVSLDFNNKEAVKLCTNILEKYSLSKETLDDIYAESLKFSGTQEIQAIVNQRLGRYISFDTSDWSLNKAILYYNHLRKDRNYYFQFKDHFYQYFIESMPFDRCFAVINILQEHPVFILQHIYQNFPTIPFNHVNCFNNDLLTYLRPENMNPFIPLEVQYFITGWETVKDHLMFNAAIKSFILILHDHASKIDSCQNHLLALLPIEIPSVVSKILSVFLKGSTQFDTHKAVYFLMISYHSPSLITEQASIIQALARCLLKEDGPEAFNTILGLDIVICRESQAKISKTPAKLHSSTIKTLVLDYKAKPIHEINRSSVKIGKQNFINNKTNEASADSLLSLDY